MKIVTTWSGEGDFKASHVQSLARQCAQFAPGVDFLCITPERIPGVDCRPGTHSWPGWWYKYEMFAPHIRGTILYLDIDSVIRDICPLCNAPIVGTKPILLPSLRYAARSVSSSD